MHKRITARTADSGFERLNGSLQQVDQPLHHRSNQQHRALESTWAFGARLGRCYGPEGRWYVIQSSIPLRSEPDCIRSSNLRLGLQLLLLTGLAVQADAEMAKSLEGC